MCGKKWLGNVVSSFLLDEYKYLFTRYDRLNDELTKYSESRKIKFPQKLKLIKPKSFIILKLNNWWAVPAIPLISSTVAVENYCPIRKKFDCSSLCLELTIQSWILNW